ncbi:MAG: hypothetical protein HY815_09380 [Candidatus Riflebacteria bacterium]|nr:hypothetical protein [Candidatus Riflebacteria bacterium]
MFHRLSGGVSRSSRLPEAILLVLGSFLAPPAIAQVTMDVNINQTGAFIPQGPTGGVFTNQLIYRSTVQAPLGQVIEVGGTGGGTHSSSRSSSAGIGRSVDSGQGGGTSIQMRVIPVPVDPTGIRERPLPQASGRQLLAELTSDDPSGRASALAEIGRRRWSVTKVVCVISSASAAERPAPRAARRRCGR